jgi:glycosyltransferase involved in cell wall biosynthesis
MKIAFFCDAYVPTRNGVATSAQTTAEELRARGHRVIIFAPRFNDYEDTDPDVVRFVAGHWFKARDYPVAYPFLSRVAPRAALLFRQMKFDVVHVHSPFVLGGIGAHWARFNFVPLVWTFHTLYHHYAHYSIMPQRNTRWYILWRIRTMLRKCDRIIAPSQAVERVILKLFPDAPTQILPTGVNLQKFASGDRETTRQKLGFEPKDTVLLFVGRIAPEKNLGFLLRSVAPLLKNRAAKLLLVGGGPDVDACRALARKLGVEDRVVLTGFIEPTTIADYYAAGDVFVFASRTETQGLSISEALCAGKPCVVVNAMGAAEALETDGDGFLVPASESRFREAVARLIDDPELRLKMGRRAQERAPLFAHAKRVDQLLELYEEVIEENLQRNPLERLGISPLKFDSE